jgi:hypothetical protein
MDPERGLTAAFSAVVVIVGLWFFVAESARQYTRLVDLGKKTTAKVVFAIGVVSFIGIVGAIYILVRAVS